MAKHRAEIAIWFRSLDSTRRIVLATASLFVLSTGGLTHVDSRLIRGCAYIAPDIGAVLLLITIIGSTRVQIALENRRFLWLGQISYSLYLSHLVVLAHSGVQLAPLSPDTGDSDYCTPARARCRGHLYRWLEAPAIALGQFLAMRIDGKARCHAAGLSAAVRV
jgi:hypothetical protein